ncbi:MAG: DUF6569 family protein [bacterium]
MPERLHRTGLFILMLFVAFLMSFMAVYVFEVHGAEDVILEKKAVGNLSKHVTIGSPVTYQNLTIFPIVSSSMTSTQRYLTLDEAIKKGQLIIEELGSGNVPKVKVKNKSSKKIFVMAGEIITGCKQDRILATDILIGPGEELVVPVYCVEQGRWNAKSDKFTASDSNAPAKLRQGAYKKESQGWIWSEVAKEQEYCENPAATGTLQQVYRDEKVKEQSNAYISHFEKIPEFSVSTNGVVVAVGGRIICMDVFANNELFRRLYNKLLKSYVLGAIKPGIEDKKVTEKDVMNFIRELEKAGYKKSENAGSGTLYVIEGGDISGAALLDKQEIVHMAVFPESK